MAQFTQQLGVFTVTDREDPAKKAFWTRIGAAFPTKDGNGLNIVLNALPTNGRLVVLPSKDDESHEPSTQG